MTMTERFEYGVARIKAIEVKAKVDSLGRRGVESMTLDGRPVRPSQRFWSSLHHRFGFTSNIFRYFTHAEVFERISQVAANDQIRWCLHKDAEGDGGTLLAVTNPASASITHNDLVGLLDRYGTQKTRYHNGILTSEHEPRLNPVFQVSGDGFQNKFVLDTPIDGYGRPAVYLSMMRLICANGL